ncbi:MAG: hypothetical protein VKL59_19380 [Nostocaceae cyanobacterium]|nr:hypothetical protein [Nostocaceae cyanobacterium]
MLEIVTYSLLLGSLGMQTAVIGGWMHWQQMTQEKQEQEEEEILTQYDAKDHAVSDKSVSKRKSAAKSSPKDPRLVGWEFKIVRANRNLFRDPAMFRRLCEEEAQAGWILVEKLDDRRVRFKRPIALREIIRSEFLPYDPYRCHYGPSWQPLNWLAAIATLTVMILPAYLGYTLVTHTMANSRQNQTLPETFPSLQKSSP